MPRGFFAIGIYHTKASVNVGTLFRHAGAFGASMVFTVGRRYAHQCSDVRKTWRSIPLMHFADIEDLMKHLPHSTPLVGIELGGRSTPLPIFAHPERACYLLGAEDHGLPNSILARCHMTTEIPCAGDCLNVAAAGTVVMYDRAVKMTREAT